MIYHVLKLQRYINEFIKSQFNTGLVDNIAFYYPYDTIVAASMSRLLTQ